MAVLKHLHMLFLDLLLLLGVLLVGLLYGFDHTEEVFYSWKELENKKNDLLTHFEPGGAGFVVAGL